MNTDRLCKVANKFYKILSENNLKKTAGLLKYNKELVSDISAYAIYEFANEVKKNLKLNNFDYDSILEKCNDIIKSYSEDVKGDFKFFELSNYYDSIYDVIAVKINFELHAELNRKAEVTIRANSPKFVLRFFKTPYPKSIEELDFSIWQIEDNTIHEVQHIHQIILAKEHGKDEIHELSGVSSKKYHLKDVDHFGKIKMPDEIDGSDKMKELLDKIKGLANILTEPSAPKSSYLPDRAKQMRVAQPLKEAEFYTILSDSIRVFNKNFTSLPAQEKKEIASMIVNHDVNMPFNKNFSNKLENKLINNQYKELINFSGWFFYLLNKYAPPGKWEKAVKEFYKGIS